MTDKPTPITVAYGDGIGPEIMESTLAIIEAAGAKLDKDVIEIGLKKFEQGHTAGIDQSAWDSLRRTKVFLKAPITTPRGGGYKSLNVTIRKSMGLYANVRPCRALHPYVQTKHPDMDLVIIRENEEDTYAGIEHRQTEQVTQCLKLISRPGCEKIVRYAFDYAVANKRKKVSCFVKDNIMKLTDGLFNTVFKEIAEEYPEIESESWIVDIGAARLADTPEIFDVIVMPNLYGDIMSDIAIQLTGSVGLGGSSNIGEHVAMFEAVHGSAPDISGQGIANPSGLLLGAVLMLVHIGQYDVAARVHNAWLRTMEDGMHTGDIYKDELSKKKLGTKEFTEAVIERIGQNPEKFKTVTYQAPPEGKKSSAAKSAPAPARKELLGVDVFLDWTKGTPDELGESLSKVNGGGLKLVMITNRGVKVWPGGMPETFCTDHWRCRFMSEDEKPIKHQQVVDLLQRCGDAGFDFIKTEHLCSFDGKPGFSLGQGQ